MEQPAIDRIEMNLKHKRIENQWGVVTMYKKSMALMIPKAPPLPPRIKPSGAPVVFEAVDTPFLPKEIRDNLEFHIKQKKLQHLWGLPLHVQKSIDAFIPPAPKIILSQLHPKPIYDIVVELSDLPFISKQHKKAIKRNIRRKTIQKRWGLPKIVLESLRSIQPPAAPIQDLQTDRAAAKTGLDKEETTLKSTDAKTDSKPEKSNLERLWTKTERMFQMYLFRKCLETRLEMLPAMVDRSYNEAYPVLKVPLIQLIPPHTTVLKPRPGFIPFIEPQAIDRLELNLKHKRIDFLWAAPTLYTKSLQIMIPKAPPLPPLIKPSGAVVAFEAVDTPFLKKELRVDLEFHVKRKKLQHLWGLPLHVQESVDAFIPPAPKIILSQLHPKPEYKIAVELSDLPFISKQHKKAIKRNIRRKTIQKRWGLPKIVLESLRSIQPPAAPIQDLQTDRAAAKTGLDKEETTLKSTDAKTDRCDGDVWGSCVTPLSVSRFPMLYQTSLCFTMLPYALPDLSVLYNASLCFITLGYAFTRGHVDKTQLDVEAERQKVNATVRTLQRQLEESSDESSHWRELLQKSKEELRSTKRELLQACAEKEELEEELQEVRGRFASMQVEVDSVRSIEAQTEQAEKLEKELQRCCEELQQALSQREQHGKTLAQRDRELAALRGALQDQGSKHQEELETLQQSLQREREQGKRSRDEEAQVDQLRAELMQERSLKQDLECDKMSLERQIKDLKSRLSIAEGSQKPSASLTQLEARIQELDERLQIEERDKSAALSSNRKLERKVKELNIQLEDERQQQQDQREQLTLRVKALKRQVDLSEEELERLENGKKKAVRDLEEQLELREQLQNRIKALEKEAW
ncbi:UNVERIFIED_CONTAM: hypothetical protein FKN15_029635 [Acipenser sinensis]